MYGSPKASIRTPSVSFNEAWTESVGAKAAAQTIARPRMKSLNVVIADSERSTADSPSQAPLRPWRT